MAEIHPQLAADCHYLGRFPLCHLLLMNDQNYPWFILLPDRSEIQEIYQLDTLDREQLLKESCLFSEFLAREFNPDKLNLAALGNQVPQLHLHHIARYRSDPAWPAPVWGKTAAVAYDEPALAAIRLKLEQAAMAGFNSSASAGNETREWRQGTVT